MKQTIIQEILTDLINIDPDLKNIKSELEKLIQELIANKPQTPFTKEFKDSLKAQIIGVINDQKITYEEKRRNRDEMLHSLKFWMIGVSTVTAGLVMFTIFYYIEDTQQPATQIVYLDSNSNLKDKESKSLSIQEETIQEHQKSRVISKETTTDSFGGGASNRAENVMMLAMPESVSTAETTTEESFVEYTMMTKTAENPEARMAIGETSSDEATTTPAPSPTPFCETSKQFILANNIAEDTTKTINYNNQIYKATINFINNNITIDHIGTQDDNKIQTELPNLNLFFKNNNFNIESDYSSPIIEETDTYFEYYYPRSNNQE